MDAHSSLEQERLSPHYYEGALDAYREELRAVRDFTGRLFQWECLVRDYSIVCDGLVAANKEIANLLAALRGVEVDDAKDAGLLALGKRLNGDEKLIKELEKERDRLRVSLCFELEAHKCIGHTSEEPPKP